MFPSQSRQIRIILVSIDFAAFILSFIVALQITRYCCPAAISGTFTLNPEVISLLFSFLVFLWMFMNWKEGLYNFGARRGSLLLRILYAGFKSYAIFIFIAFLFRQIQYL